MDMDKTVQQWDTRVGKLRRTLIENTDSVYGFVLNPDGTTLASAGVMMGWCYFVMAHGAPITSGFKATCLLLYGKEGFQMKITMTLFTLLVLLLPNSFAREYSQWSLAQDAIADLGKSTINEICYSPDGTRLAVASSLGIWFYDTASYQVENSQNGEVTLLTGHSGEVISVAFSPDGKTLASGGDNGEVHLWNSATGELKGTLTGHTDVVLNVAFSSDGKMLASGTFWTLRLWDIMTGDQKWEFSGEMDSIRSLAFSPEGVTLASGGWDGTIRLWEAETGELKETLDGHTATVLSVAFSPDGRTLASGSADRTIRLWDTKKGRLKRTLSEHTDSVMSVSFSPNGRLFASGGWDGTVRLWDAATWRHKQTLTGHMDGVCSVSFSPEGKGLASASEEGAVFLCKIGD